MTGIDSGGHRGGQAAQDRISTLVLGIRESIYVKYRICETQITKYAESAQPSRSANWQETVVHLMCRGGYPL
jgi:hypothetical protein